MDSVQVAYRLRTLFDQKITAEYYDSFKGRFGRVQVEVLSHLYEHKQARVQELADILNIPKQHASKIISRLEEQGLIARASDPNDHRSTLYSLSDGGRALMEEHLRISNQRFAQRLERLIPQEQQAMLQAMNTVADMLEKL